MNFTVESYTKEYMNKTNNHLYIAPISSLEWVVAHYTITFTNDDTVIPEGSVLNLIPDVSGCFVFKFFDKLSIMVWGPTTKVVTVANDLNTAKCRFFVEFLPGGLYQVLGIDVKNLLDKKVELEELMPEFYSEINERLKHMQSFDEVVDMMNELLYREVQKHPIESFFLEYIELIYRNSANIKTKLIADDLGISERQLTRYFHRYVGMTVKKYSKIANVNHLIQEIIDKKLLDLAYDYDYYDQAHLNHVFKDICETTPNQYINNLSDFYNELYKF